MSTAAPLVTGPPSEREGQSVPARRSLLRRLFGIVRNGLAIIGLVFIIYHTCFHASMVVSGSMAPTLCGEGGPDSDWLLSERISYWFRRPRRWEVVHFYTKAHLLVAKRVVGLPGESVSLIDKRVAIDGRPAPCPASLEPRRYLPFGNLRQGKAAACGNEYYVLGDDSKDSEDSRFEGTVTPDRIRSRAWLIIWPPARIGFVTP